MFLMIYQQKNNWCRQTFVDMTDDEISDLRTEDNEKILSLQDVFNRYGNTVNYVIELKENSNQTKLFEDLVKK